MYSTSPELDLLLVGGGLQNVLIALAVLSRHPQAKVLVLEQAEQILGNHTWCFHAGDVTAESRPLIDDAVTASWSAYDVHFPDHQRHVQDTYSAITSDTLRELLTRVVEASPKAAVMCGTRAVDVSAHEVKLDDGRTLSARLVIDARGPDVAPNVRCAYQKFVGLEVETKAPTKLSCPVLMDGCVEQTDGLRFFYLLPLRERRILIEDTYFSDSPTLDVPFVRREIESYALRHGIHIESVVRMETGVLPLPLRSMAFEPKNPLMAGYAGGFFHPATGYSFPVALRLAVHIADHFADPFAECFRQLLTRHASQFRFAAFLNRLLFTAFRPEDRWHAMSRFYRLPVDTIRRFYSLDTKLTDRARILCGRPPSGISAGTLFDRGAFV